MAFRQLLFTNSDRSYWIILNKVLDRMGGPVLYKQTALIRMQRTFERKNSMMTSWTNHEHTAKRQRRGGMRAVCLPTVLSLSPVNRFNGKLGNETSIDSRYSRH
jgi:hypothetical protein